MSIFALCLSASIAVQVPPVEFTTIPLAGDHPPIAFVRVEQVEGGIALGVYSKNGLIAVWPDDAAGAFSWKRLTANQEYVLDSSRWAMAIKEFHLPCLDLALASRLTDFTWLEFPEGYPWVDPTLPPPEPVPPPPVVGARSVYLSADARLAIFVEASAESELPREVKVFRRPEASSASFELSGTYTNRGLGEIKTSLEGRRFAQREGDSVRVFDGANAEQPLATLPLTGPFDVSADGAWLARALPEGMALDPLGSTSEARNGSELRARTFALGKQPLGMHFANGWLVVREARGVLLFDPAQESPRWVQPAQHGNITSTDVLVLSQERALVAIASLEILRPPMRRAGKFHGGRAVTTVEVVDTLTGTIVARDRFELSLWDRGVPRVRLVSGPIRAIVTTPEAAKVSGVIQ